MVVRLPQHGWEAGAPTVAEVLGCASLRRGDPVVIGGVAGLDRRVRWVHLSEFTGIGSLMRGGELLLTMGLTIPDSPSGQSAYIDQLAAASVAALVVGLGQRYVDTLPPPMVAAADRHGLPLIVLRRTIAFIDVTEEVHAELVDRQVHQLRITQNIHTTFTALALQGSAPEVVLRQIAKLSAQAMVLEDRAHQLIAFDPCDRAADDVLSEWQEHTKRPVDRRNRTSYDPVTGWLQTAVGARGNDWGRLVIMAGDAGVREPGSSKDPTLTVPQQLIVLIEQAASALAIGRLADRETQTLALNLHGSLLDGLLSDEVLDRDVEQEAAALGVSFRRKPLLALALRDRDAEGRSLLERQRALRALGTAVSELFRGETEVVVGPVSEVIVAALLPADPHRPPTEQIAHLVERLRVKRIVVRAGYASPVTGTAQLRGALTEAIEVVSLAAAMNVAAEVSCAADLGVRGLLFALRDDRRVRAFAERALGVLIAHDQTHGTNFTFLLRHYLQAGRNKTRAARNAYVSRPWMHERLHTISTLLDVDLDDEETCLRLQLALMIAEADPG